MPSTSLKTPWKARNLPGKSANRSGRGTEISMTTTRKPAPSSAIQTADITGELAARCDEPPFAMTALRDRCLQPEVAARPSAAEIAALLEEALA